jgi:flagellar hook-basal body complex protein FliE
MIERTDIQSVLMQMRAMKDMAQTGVSAAQMPTAMQPQESVSRVDGENSFGTLLKNAVNTVNNTQMEASRLATAYEQGDSSVELTQVMIQLQKASVSFQAMTEVRNRLVTAYEDVMNMSI